MSGYANLHTDFSDVLPSDSMLAALSKARRLAKEATNWTRIKIGNQTVAYCCSPRCADMTIAILVAEQDEGSCILAGEPYAVSLTDRGGLPKADYKDVRCFCGCPWRVV